MIGVARSRRKFYLPMAKLFPITGENGPTDDCVSNVFMSFKEQKNYTKYPNTMKAISFDNRSEKEDESTHPFHPYREI